MVENLKVLGRDLLEWVKLAFYSGIMGLVLPILILFKFGGVEVREIFDKSVLYIGIFGASLLLILAFIFYKNFKKGLRNEYEPLCLYSKNSTLSKISIFNWVSSPLKLFLISAIIFTIIGLFSVSTNTFFSSAPTQQQFTTTGGVISAAEPAATSENLLLFFIMNLALLGVYILATKYNWSPETTTIISTIAVIIFCVMFWIFYHSAKYGGQETAMLAVIIFAFFGSIITVVTRSFIPWHIWHFCNNLFLTLGTHYSTDSIMIVTVLAVILPLILITILVFTFIPTKKEIQQIYGNSP
jgi:hypothetical protein